MVQALKNGAKLYAGIEHDAYNIDAFEVPQVIRNSLCNDFDDISIN